MFGLIIYYLDINCVIGLFINIRFVNIYYSCIIKIWFLMVVYYISCIFGVFFMVLSLVN